MNYKALKRKAYYLRAISVGASLFTLTSATEAPVDKATYYLEEARACAGPDRKANLLARSAKMGNKTALQDLLESVEAELERVKKESEEKWS